MPRTRSRPRTEARFQEAVLELLAEDGCAGLGVNAVAQRAGADKVLIYRYFGDLDGLLSRVAESRPWLPEPSEVLGAACSSPEEASAEAFLRRACAAVVRHIEADAATRQALFWRRTGNNALTGRFSTLWRIFWEELADGASRGLDYDERADWREACALAALLAEAEVAKEALGPAAYARAANGLRLSKEVPAAPVDPADEEERLPTNLL